MNAGKNRSIIDSDKLNKAISSVMDTAKKNMIKFQGRFPKPYTKTGFYDYRGDKTGWHEGFWGGIYWLCYEMSGDIKLRRYAEQTSESLYTIIHDKNISHSDLGLMYIPTCVADYKLTKNEEAKEAAIMAADRQLAYYNRPSNVVCASPEEIDGKIGTCKISNLLNMLLLFFAGGVTGNPKYCDVAQDNIDIILKHNITDEGKVFFRYYFDLETGKPLHDESTGASKRLIDSSFRNYAWAISGLAAQYAITRGKRIEDLFDKVLNYMLSKTEGDICNYKLLSHGDNNTPDTTATAIVVCGILEMITNLPKDNNKANLYKKIAGRFLNTLIDDYSLSSDSGYEGLLSDGCWCHESIVTNSYTVCGDYFYLEALIRCYKDWKSYWH